MDIRALIEAQLEEAAGNNRRYVHPRLAKMFAMAGMDGLFHSADGPYLLDAHGNRTLDLLAGGGVHFLGRNPPGVNKALRQVLEMDLPNLTIVNPALLSGLLARKLLELADNRFGKVIFANSGSECTEVCIRFARYLTRRRRYLYLEGAFHGRTFGAISMCGFPELREGQEPLLPVCTPIQPNDLKQLRRELAHGDVAGLIVEPVQGMTCRVLDPGYLREAELLCEKHGTLLIADEVQTGLGRTGSWFATLGAGVRPHMMTLSKTLAGGQVPVGAVLVREEVYEKVFDKFKAGPFYFSTFAENNLAMAAGLATLEALEEIDAPRKAARLGQMFRDGLRTLAAKHDVIERVEGKGLMIAIYFRDASDLKLKLQQKLMQAGDKGAFAAAVHVDLFREHRVLVQLPGPGLDAIKMLPPVTLEEEHVRYFIEALDQVLEGYRTGQGPAVNLGRTLLQAVSKDALSMVPEGFVPPALKAALTGQRAAAEESFEVLEHDEGSNGIEHDEGSNGVEKKKPFLGAEG